jgi:hypothetical protein
VIPNKREKVGLAFVENATTEVKLAKGFLETGIILSGNYIATLTTGATAVREYAVPIKSISLIGDGGKTIAAVKPADLIAEALIYEQAPLSAILTKPAAFGIAAHPGSFAIRLSFEEPNASHGDVTMLPTWMYDELTLRVEWGSVAEVFVLGAGVGSVAMAVAPSVVQDGVEDDFSGLGDPFAWGARLLRALRSYKEAVVTAVADTEHTIELPRTADYRSIVIVTEDANGEPVATILNKVTLLVNNNQRQLSKVPAAALRQDNATLFGVPMPTGYHVVEFAEDGDIIPPAILPARQFTALDLVLDKAAVAGKIRAYFKRIETFSNA